MVAWYICAWLRARTTNKAHLCEENIYIDSHKLHSTLRTHKDVWNRVFVQTPRKPVSMVPSGGRWMAARQQWRGGIWYTDAKPVSKIPMPKQSECRATKLQQCSSWIVILTLQFLERRQIQSNNSWIIFRCVESSVSQTLYRSTNNNIPIRDLKSVDDETL